MRKILAVVILVGIFIGGDWVWSIGSLASSTNYVANDNNCSNIETKRVNLCL